MPDDARGAGTKADPIDLGFEAHGFEVTSLHGDGPTIGGPTRSTTRPPASSPR